MLGTLTRLHSLSDGIFSKFEIAGRAFYTATHAYPTPQDTYVAKVPAGRYVCQRGIHRLEGMLNSFETFQIMNVPNFQGQPVTNILFHVGNYPMIDSEGCELLGNSLDVVGTPKMVGSSKIAFQVFMNLLNGQDQFDLEVV